MERSPILRLPPELCAMVCQHMEFRDLFSLAHAYRHMCSFATEELFRQDAATRNSSAILWAASASGVPKYAELASSTLKRSIQHGGDVNARHCRGDATCTAIHVAAAQGDRHFVEELISHEARLDTCSLRLWKFLDVGRFNKGWDKAKRLGEFAKKNRLQNQYWFLLLPAMFRHEHGTASLLMRHISTGGYLAIDHKYLFLPPLKRPPPIDTAYTIHHLLIEENVFPELQKSLYEKFRYQITVPGSVSRMSPLMRAIKKGNEAATDILFPFTQDFDVVSSLGWSALSYAVEGASVNLTPKKRDWSASVAKRLLESGADVNVGRPSSPLMLAVTSLIEDKVEMDAKHTNRMRSMIRDLLFWGADVNVLMYPSGCSLSQYLFLKMQKEKHRHIRSLFTEFLGRNMSVNDLFPDGTSLLARSVASTTLSNKVTDELLARDARPAEHEYDDILRLWLAKDKSMTKNLVEVLPSFAPKFSQPAVDRAYSQVVLNNAIKQFETLSKWREPSKPAQLLGTALRHKFARREMLYLLPFNRFWQNRSGQNYAHIIVEEVGKRIYSEREAIEEMICLIAEGVNLGQRDYEGKTVLQRLTQVREAFGGEDPLSKLQTFLMRSRLEELDNEI